MLRTIWNDHARYEQYWKQIPGVLHGRRHRGPRHATATSRCWAAPTTCMNVAGHRIGTADVESSLLRHPAVAESAVVGLPDPLKGERIKAFVVLRAGRRARAPAWSARSRTTSARTSGPSPRPSEIEIRASLPKTRSGKIMRRYLKAVEMGEDPGDVSTHGGLSGVTRGNRDEAGLGLGLVHGLGTENFC